MNTKKRLLLIVAILITGGVVLYLNDQFLVTRSGTFLKDELEARHEVAGGGGKEALDSLPAIDFPQLDQARSLDLIEMELDFPESLKELEGRRVSLVGFMAPFDNLQDMQRCMIVPSYVGCTFCSPPSLTQVVYVTQGTEDQSRRPYPFIEEPSYVTGTLRLSLPGSDNEGTQQGFIYSIEDAVVTPHTGVAPTRLAAHESTGKGQAVHQPGAMLPLVETGELVSQVAGILEREPAHPVGIELVSRRDFEALVRAEVEGAFPEESRAARGRAFHLMGLIPDGTDWGDALTGNLLARRASIGDEPGQRIYLLETVNKDHPYVRLDLVGEIADAIVRQHFSIQQIESDDDRPGTENEDARRAIEALREGVRIMTVYRYSRARGISQAAPLPAELFQRAEATTFSSVEFELWQSLPSDIGPFFVDFLVGATGPFSGAEAAFAQPPSTTIEFFRPRWFLDSSLWQPDPVPGDFADTVMNEPPTHTDVLGVGGLIPWLVQWYPVDVAKSFVGLWAGDRWAVWSFPDGGAAVLLETRWQSEDAAIRFREAIPEELLQVKLPHESGSVAVRLLFVSSEEVLSRLDSVDLNRE